jgi:hypothetical protein
MSLPQEREILLKQRGQKGAGETKIFCGSRKFAFKFQFLFSQADGQPAGPPGRVALASFEQGEELQINRVAPAGGIFTDGKAALKYFGQTVFLNFGHCPAALIIFGKNHLLPFCPVPPTLGSFPARPHVGNHLIYRIGTGRPIVQFVIATIGLVELFNPGISTHPSRPIRIAPVRP